MVDPVTVNRGYAVPTRGSDVGTWDTPLNGDFNLIDQNLGGITSIITTGGSTTLNSAQLACGTINITGTLTSDAVIVFPAVQGWWSIANMATVGAFAVFIVCGTQATSIGMPPGEITDIQINTNTPSYRNLGRVGSYLDLAVTSVPRWISGSTAPPYLNCDGTTFSAVTYPFLSSILGGTTLPDIRGGSRASLNQGTGRITTGNSGIDGNTLLSRGGSELMQQHTHVAAGNTGNESNTHTHSYNPPVPFGASGAGAGIDGARGTDNTGTESTTHTHAFSVTTTAAGAGSSQNMPPMTIAGLTLIRAA